MALAWCLVPCLPFPGLQHIYFLFTVRLTNERVGVFLARLSVQHLALIRKQYMIEFYYHRFFFSIENIEKNVCVLNLLSGVPQYQSDQKFCRDGLTDNALAFESQKCGIYFSHHDYTTPQIIHVTGAADNMINFNDRLAVLQIYHDASKTNTNIPELHLWNGIMLPELKVILELM